MEPIVSSNGDSLPSLSESGFQISYMSIICIFPGKVKRMFLPFHENL